MSKDTIKKLIAGALAAGAIGTGSIQVANRLDCDYTIQNEGKEICVSQAQIDAVKEAQGTWQSVQTWDE